MLQASSETAEAELVKVLSGTAEGGISPGSASVVPGGQQPLLSGTYDTASRQAAAAEVQQLVVAGKRQEALRVATGAGLWGLALLLATSCGGNAFTETAVAMAQAELAAGTPLRTLSLMLAGKPELVTGGQGGPGSARHSHGTGGLGDMHPVSPFMMGPASTSGPMMPGLALPGGHEEVGEA